MEAEIWKAVRDYEGLYEVSNLGRVRSLDRKEEVRLRRGRIYVRCVVRGLMRVRFGRSHYPVITLSSRGRRRTFYVHRLVAAAFVPNPKRLPCVNHLDGSRCNNRPENLEWCTHKQNIRHAIRIGHIGGAKGEKHPNYSHGMAMGVARDPEARRRYLKWLRKRWTKETRERENKRTNAWRDKNREKVRERDRVRQSLKRAIKRAQKVPQRRTFMRQQNGRFR